MENSFVILKRRFSFCKTGVRLDLENIPRAILACVILHNLALDLRMPVPDEEAAGDDHHDDDAGEEEEMGDVPRQLLSERRAREEGNRVRDELAHAFD